YSDNEPDLLKYQLEHFRPGVQLNSLPETKLAKDKIQQEDNDVEHRSLVIAVNSFLRMCLNKIDKYMPQALKEHDSDESDTIDSEELLAALENVKLFPPSDRKILFGDSSSETILKSLDKDGNGKIKFNELMTFMEESDINMHYRSQGYERRTTGNIFQFLYVLYDTVLTHVKRVYVENISPELSMGNKFSYTKQTNATDLSREALDMIRETRQKYLNNHTKENEVSDFEGELSTDINLGLTDSLDDTHTLTMTRISLDMNSMPVSNSLDTSGISINKDDEREVSMDSGAGTSSSVRPDKTTVIKDDDVELEMYTYPFENIVFEGGGTKGLAYCGAIRRLEELGVMKQIKRFAGTSAGSMTAALLAVGYDSRDLEEFFKLNLNDLLIDHSWGFLSLVPNLFRFYGWNPGERIYNWFGEKIKEKTGKEDITFQEVYNTFDRELCIVVTNVNQMTPLYCHPKTTPDMSIRLAVRMSLSIPGLFGAVEYTQHGHTDFFVDGGVLCNYPIHCFDGWWLSMKKEDNFFERLQNLEDIPRLLDKSERFGKYNNKTLGLQVYSDDEPDLLKYQLEHSRPGIQLNSQPETKLAKAKIQQENNNVEHRSLVKAVNSFLRALKEHDTDESDTIDSKELLAALEDEKLFPTRDRKILFGDSSSETILNCLDKDGNGQIKFNELMTFMEESDINMHYRSQGYERRTTGNVFQFLHALYDTVLTHVERVYVEEKDWKRTVGINTGYIGTTDFNLEPADVKFLCERGRLCLDAFLKSYVAANDCEENPKYESLDDVSRNSKDSLICSNFCQSLGSSDDASMKLTSTSLLSIWMPNDQMKNSLGKTEADVSANSNLLSIFPS
ncbi:hypothetical protein Btru_027688, partial [Bulinus truncatus]